MAATTSLTRSQFDVIAQNSITTIEDFESFAVGALASPVALANSTYTAETPYIAQDFGMVPTRAMFSGAQIHETRVFSSFLPGTTLFGADIRTFQPTFETVRVTVQGRSGSSGVQTLFGETGLFVGFYDPAGLISVTVRSLGRSDGGTTVHTNYGMDNVITGRPIPEPSSVHLIIGLVVGCVYYRGRSTHQTPSL